MALGSPVSPNGSQPILWSASPSYRSSNSQNTEASKDGIKTLRWTVTAVVTSTVVIYITCTKLYISSAPDLSITGFIKTAMFTVCMLCNTVPMIASVEAIVYLIRPEHPSDFGFRVEANIGALALVTVSFVSMFVAFMVGVFLVVILRIWHSFFYV
ncbi:unnamed protein product [Eruca vesicaria subsp. sativa]|uniref:PGG domain-containing protein n=1 Tax=Eruca vesicaria subsp. sativa TaxID=29727 RepID=A0ABC8JRL5_ERUVS|nr:unnamed protein product [Eruca vesicaria subsp. sativa]